jgi:hypothetical protein
VNHNVVQGKKMPANALVQARIDSAVKEEAAAALALIGLVSAAIPAQKALTVNPAKLLRDE